MSNIQKKLYNQADLIQFEYVRGGKLWLRPKWREPWYTMPYWITGVWLAGAGSLRFKPSARNVDVREGDVTIIPPGTMSSGLVTSPEPVCVCWMHIKFTLLNSIDLLQFFNFPVKIGSRKNERLREIYLQLNYWANTQEYEWCVCAARKNFYAFELLCWFFDNFELKIDFNSIVERRKRFVPATDYIQLHKNEKIELKHLARLMNMSLSSFQRHFKSAFGQPAGEYIMALRFDEAYRMLADQDISIAQIAENTGFCDQFQFSRIFRKRTGQSPSQYRKNLSEKLLREA